MRLVAITAGEADDDQVASICAAVAPGQLTIQVRGKHLSGRALHALTVRLLAIAGPAGVAVWVNDRVDLAVATGAAGVHLPEAGFTVATARALAPGRAIGVSRHRGDRLDDDAADRVHLGPIWATPSKAGLGEPLGTGALTQARARVAGTLVAVGGVDGPDRAYAAAVAGADAVAVIRALWSAADPGATARALVDAVAAGVRARAR